MLSSIHPLGERARTNRWPVTISAFTLGAVTAGATVGAAMGWVGSLTALREHVALVVVGALALTAGGLDLIGVRAPGPRRQVNERWIGSFRGTVYGFGFGAQLGVGVATFVVTWGVWLVFAAAFLAGSIGAGALIGGLFGLGRALAPLAAGWIDRPSRLTAFHTRMAALAGPVHMAAGWTTALVGMLAILRGV